MSVYSFDLLGDRAESSAASLSRDEVARYSRHVIMPEVGMAGQKRLKASSVLCIGAGGLGSPLVLYLAAAGVGRLGLVDFDSVDLSNLQRQIAHFTSDIGRPKLDSAADKLLAMNPHLRIDRFALRLDASNALELFRDYDVIVDGTDNFATRYLVNDACALLGKPNVYGSIFRFDGQASVFFPPHGPCYRCLYPEPPPPDLVPSCAEGGVLGILPGVIGVIQATETIKLLLGAGKPLMGRLLLYDALDMSFREMKVRKNPKCPICGEAPTIKGLIDYEAFCSAQRGGSPMTAGSTPIPELSVTELKAKLDAGESFTLLDVRNLDEIEICRISGSVVIPLPELPARAGELDPGKPLVVHCKSGGRSAKAVAFLREAGFPNALNLKGGILGWIREIDPTLTPY